MARLLSIVAFVIAMDGVHAAGQSLRCGNALVRAGDSVDAVLARCGQPDEIRRKGVYFATGKAIGDTCYTGPVAFEEWVYERGTTRLRAVVTVEGGKVRDIRIGDRDSPRPRRSCR